VAINRVQLISLLESPRPADLGPGPRAGVLSVAQIEAGIADIPVTARELVRALVLLWHDHLDESHRVAQEIKNADGSFIHAIMHRREPDYSNAKYWWHRVGDHPAFPEIAARVDRLLKERGVGELAKQLLPGGKWDACAFVDACENASAEDQPVLREIQRIETEVLLERFTSAD